MKKTIRAGQLSLVALMNSSNIEPTPRATKAASTLKVDDDQEDKVANLSIPPEGGLAFYRSEMLK